MRHWIVLCALLLASPAAATFSPHEMLADPALEARARALSREIRCVVCQNESIHDSPADIARDLRRLVRERIVAGDSDQQILAFLVERYGDFALMQPPVARHTYVLWFGPAVVLAAGAVAVALSLRRRQRAHAPVLSDDEAARVDALLKDRP
jgi:cytochrome c-type biogenesis protein CcmH